MHRRSRSLFAIALTFAVVAAVPALAVPQDDAAAGIARANAAWEAAVVAGDADALASLYTDDAMFMEPNAPASVGHDAIRAAMAGLLAMGIGKVDLTTDELVAHGDMAHEVGRYVITATDGSHMDHGKYVVIWKRTAGGWKLHRDIFNSDMAAPQG